MATSHLCNQSVHLQPRDGGGSGGPVVGDDGGSG